MVSPVRTHPLASGVPPAWATTWGQDQYGLFAGFTVGATDIDYLFRWIPPGTFWMGSPETEEGRLDNEIRHLVTLSEGFWLGQTPVTQAVWEAVMGDNPSRFRSAERPSLSANRPVENVSWDDVKLFLARLNGTHGGVLARLPTEAEWEYACRAGTVTATYAGDLDLVARANAPILDAIAWYSGNSGVDLDIGGADHPFDETDQQYPTAKLATRRVGLKRPNAWGLRDMLGNVYEWCEDWFGNYPTGQVKDPQGPTEGAGRVVRGGSWGGSARYCRAAYRGAIDPSVGVDDLGFRFVRGQAP